MEKYKKVVEKEQISNVSSGMKWKTRITLSDIPDYFEYILKKHIDQTNQTIRIYVNKIENKITFRINTRYYLEYLIPETMKLLGGIKHKMTKDEKSEN